MLHPSPKIPANLRARVQQPSPTLRPNLPCLLRWNPDADANARHTGSKDVVNQLALLRALHPTLAALPPPARTVRTTADASARHAGTEKAALSVTTGTAAPCSSSGSSTDSPLISCVSTPARRMVKKIKRGEYTDFDTLLSPTDDAVPGQAVAPKKCRKTKRQVCNLQSWLEAWNSYLARRLPRQRCIWSNIRPSCASCFLPTRLHQP